MNKLKNAKSIDPDNIQTDAIIKLPMQHQLTIDQKGEMITISGTQHGQSIVILLYENGMEIHAQSSKLKLQATEEIELAAPKIKLNAEKDISLISKGNLITQVSRDSLQECAGVNKSIASDQKLVAKVGNVEIKANDDVKVDGERVLLNS